MKLVIEIELTDNDVRLIRTTDVTRLMNASIRLADLVLADERITDHEINDEAEIVATEWSGISKSVRYLWVAARNEVFRAMRGAYAKDEP